MPDSKISAPDLTQRPPRSPRCRLGGYVILPRLLDKGRATIAGTNGEFIYDAPVDLDRAVAKVRVRSASCRRLRSETSVQYTASPSAEGKSRSSFQVSSGT